MNVPNTVAYRLLDDPDYTWIEHSEFERMRAEWTRGNDVDRWEFTDGSAIVECGDGQDVGVHADWIDDREVESEADAIDNWHETAAFIWPAAIYGVDNHKFTLPMPRYAAMDGMKFNLTHIQSEFVVVQASVYAPDLFAVGAGEFKQFMRETASWDGNINPYDNYGEPTKFGTELFNLDINGDWEFSFDLRFPVWLFQFDEESECWSLEFTYVFYDVDNVR